tara:strand:+ start:283 stop:582 length:300 start_codon:yes stop_codon:yes gene_type:complete
MKNKLTYIFVVLFWITVSCCLAQDTTHVSITLADEKTFVKPEGNNAVCLHFLDGVEKTRDVTVFFKDGSHMHHTFPTKNNKVCSVNMKSVDVISISKAK